MREVLYIVKSGEDELTHLVKYIADLLAKFSPISKQCPLSECSNEQGTRIRIREPPTFPIQYNIILFFFVRERAVT